MKGKARRLLSWVCVLALCMSLLPVTALAVPGSGNTSSLTPEDKYYTLDGREASEENADITLSKQAVDKGDGTYTVTLSATAKRVVTAKPTEVVFVIDGSGSMNWCEERANKDDDEGWIGEGHYHGYDRYGVPYCTLENKGDKDSRWDIALGAIETMMDNLGEEGISYKFVVYKNSYHDYAKEFDSFSDLQSIKPSGGTYLSAGVKEAVDAFKMDNANQVMIIVADGDSGDGYPTQQASQFKKKGGDIYTVGFTFSSNEFNNLSNGPGYYFTANDADQLKLSMEQISENIKGLISDPLGDKVELVGGVKGVEVSYPDSNSTGNLWVTGDTINWTHNKGLNGTVTLIYTVKLKDSEKKAGEYSVALNDQATLNYRYSSWGDNYYSNSVDFPAPVAAVKAATLDIQVKDGSSTSPIGGGQQWLNLDSGNAFNLNDIPDIGDSYNGKWVESVTVTAKDGNRNIENVTIDDLNDPDPYAYTVTITLTDEEPGPVLDPQATPIKVRVMVDGEEMSAGANVGTYVTVSPDQAKQPASWDEASQGPWDPGTFHEESDTVTYDVTYYDCKDISFKATDGYVIEAVDADLVYGQRGCQGITNNNGTVTADNVKGGSTVTVYVRSAYTVEYYQDRAPLSGGFYDDTTQYVAETTALTPTTDTAQNPTDTGYYHVDCGCNNPEECEHKGYTNASGGQPETEYIKTFEQKDEITLPDLPKKANYTVTGWYLNEDGTGDTKSGTIPVSEVAENADNDRVIKFYSESTPDTAGYTVKYVFLDENGNVIPDTSDWTSDSAKFPQNGSATIGTKVDLKQTDPALPKTVTRDDDNYVLVDGNYSCEITAEGPNNITVTYALDNWNDEGNTETGGDNTPDYQQALIKYVSNENGSVAPQLDVITLSKQDGNNKYSGEATANSKATAAEGYAFDYWTEPGDETSWNATLNDSFTAQGGQTYTYTANFAEDKNGDGTPDKYQVFVNFKSANTTQGNVSTKEGATSNTGITQVYTFENHATSGDVTPSLAGVDVKANEGFAFDIWTKDDGTDKVNPEALLEAVEGGTTITFYARFTAVENVTVNKELVKVNNENYDGTSKVNSGDVLTYQITVQNTGGADATNGGNPFVLADTMWKDGAPDNYQVTFTDANGNSQDLTGIYTIEGDSVKIGAIPARSQYVFTYTYTVQQSDEGKTLENTATLAYNAEETIEDTVKVDVEKTHCIITYEYQSGSDGMQLPTEAEGFPPVPASQTLEIGGTVQLPTPETIQVRVEGGVWIFLGWYTDEGLLNPPIIARDDMTIIGLWVFNEAYTLTYDANGGDNGSVPTDSTAYTEGQTATLNTENKPTHAQAPTPEGSVITDEELVDVVFIGWSTTQTDKIFAAGEDYGDIVTQVTFQDQDITVYAVWGYDENGDGIADAQQIVITPADITIYTGGQSYDGIVEGENGEIAENNGMPEPGFYFILPYELDNELGGRGNTEDLTGKLRLHYENGDDIRTWDLALYNEEAGTANKVYGKYYIYRLKPVNNNDLVVRVEIQDGDRLVTSDQFDISLNGELYKEYTMTLYTNSVEQNLVTAQTNVDGTGTDWTPRDTQGIALGTGTLTIRGTNDETPVSPIQGDVIAPVEEITAKAAEGTEYTINDSNLPVVNQDAVQLLNDSLVEGSTDALKDAIVDEAATDDSVTITEDYQFDFCYLDLVDTSNGNAYATTNQPLEIYWPYPDGTNQDTTFYIAHFDGLDREFDPNNLENELNGAELKIYSANTDNSDLKLENTEQGIKISTSTFSPFVLVYNQKDAAAPSLTVDKELTAVNGKTPGSSVSVGDTLTYTITVTNNGNVDLTNVSVKDTFNGKGTLNFAASDDYTATNNNDGTYTITLNSNLAVDNSVKITATYKVLRGDANGTLTNAVSVTGKTTDGTEIPTPGEDTEETPVNPYHPPIRPPEDPDKPELNTEDHYAYIVGYEDGTVQPEGDITRAEVATIFFRLLTDESRNEYWSQTNPYSDVSADDWFNNAVSTLTNAGVLDGYEDGTFKPNGNITRAEFATITARFFEATYDGENLFPDIEGHWAQDYINEAANAGIVNGYEDGTFRPQQYITRAEAVTMVNRTIERHPDADHLLDDMIVWPDNPETAWYYEQIQEATNSHEYTMNTDDEQNPYEIWTNLLPNRDWSELEKEWSDANDGAGSGEVV